MSAEDLSFEETIIFSTYDTGFRLAFSCRKLDIINCAKDENSFKALSDVISRFTTDLWDQFFSQGEIREAFESALMDLDRYAAGDERRT